MRYNYRPTRMSRETSSSLVAVDQSTDVALCITNNIGPGEKIQAVGRYYYVAQGNCAEVAFIVREEQQGKGMAKTLLRWLISIARERNLDAVIAYTRKDNRPMQNIFSAFDFKRVQQDQDEIYFQLTLKPQ